MLYFPPSVSGYKDEYPHGLWTIRTSCIINYLPRDMAVAMVRHTIPKAKGYVDDQEVRTVGGWPCYRSQLLERDVNKPRSSTEWL